MHRCPAKNCTTKISGDLVACKAHWFKIPKPLRDKIWALY